MPKMPKDRLPPGWRFDPDDMRAHDTYAPYILLPDGAIPLVPLPHAVAVYLAAKQINAFLRAL
jgi:hypothetical protein